MTVKKFYAGILLLTTSLPKDDMVRGDCNGCVDNDADAMKQIWHLGPVHQWETLLRLAEGHEVFVINIYFP